MSSIKSFFTKNLSLKFLSLLLAISLWLFVVTVENRTDYFPGEINIETQNLAPNLAPVYDQDTVRVKISAPASVWKKLVLEDFVAFVDLGNLSLGTHQVPVKVTSSVPGVQIVELDPAEIRVRVETAVTAQLNVSSRLEGQLAAGYEVMETKLDPVKIEARGARDLIDSVSQATAVVNLAGQDRDIEQKVKLSAYDEYDKQVKNIIFSPEKVTIKISVAKSGGGKVVGIKPKFAGSVASGYWISNVSFEPASIRVTGNEDVVEKLEWIETQPINIAGLNQDKEFEITPALPKGAVMVEGETETIIVKVKVSLSAQTREIAAGFSYSGLGSGVTVQGMTPQNVIVMVSGPPGLLQNLSADNVVINLDLSGRSSGSHMIGIGKDSISVPNGVSIISYIPNNVVVNIK